MSGISDTTIQAFSLFKVEISAFMASQYPALSGPFMASCHLWLSEVLSWLLTLEGSTILFNGYED